MLTKKLLLIIVISLGIIIGGLFLLLLIFPLNTAKNQINSDNQMTLFYGKGCPHCAIVEKYIKANNVQKKLKFEEKEVYYNKTNAQQLIEKAKKCGLSTQSIGVPFFWTGSHCLIGDNDIINFFKEQLNKNKS